MALINTIKTSYLSLIILVLFGSQIWQPFYLGFHHDDWSVFALPYYNPLAILNFGDRAGYFLVNKFILAIWNGDYFWLQWIKISINLITAFSISYLVLQLQKLTGEGSKFIALISGGFWLTAPWGLGYTLWTSASIGNLAIALFSASISLVILWWNSGKIFQLIFSIILFGLGLTIYQSIWFAYLPLLFLIFLLSNRDRNELLKLALVIFLFSAVQLLFVLNSINSSPKSFNENFYVTLVSSIINGPYIFIDQIGLIGLISIVIAYLLASALSTPTNRYHLYNIAIKLALISSGILISIIIYSSANYRISGIGEGSRTTVMITFWIALLLGSITIKYTNALNIRALMFISLFFILPNLLAYRSAAKPWVDSWAKQIEVLSTIKDDPISLKIMQGDIIFTNIPMNINHIAIFSAPWDITPAALITWRDKRPDLIQTFPLPITIIPPYPQFQIQWASPDLNNKLAGKLKLAQGWEYEASRLWLWSWNNSSSTIIEQSTNLDVGLFNND